MHFFNVISVAAFLIMVFVIVESPNHLIKEGKYQQALDALNKISRVNSFFSRDQPYVFTENLSIFLSNEEMIQNEKNNLLESTKTLSTVASSLAKSQDSQQPEIVIINQNPGFLQVSKMLIRDHTKIFILLLFLRIYISNMWFINLYLVQKNNA